MSLIRHIFGQTPMIWFFMQLSWPNHTLVWFGWGHGWIVLTSFIIFSYYFTLIQWVLYIAWSCHCWLGMVQTQTIYHIWIRMYMVCFTPLLSSLYPSRYGYWYWCWVLFGLSIGIQLHTHFCTQGNPRKCWRLSKQGCRQHLSPCSQELATSCRPQNFRMTPTQSLFLVQSWLIKKCVI